MQGSHHDEKKLTRKGDPEYISKSIGSLRFKDSKSIALKFLSENGHTEEISYKNLYDLVSKVAFSFKS